MRKQTKKIITVTVVWICDPNYHEILPRVIDHLRSHIKCSKVCFIRYPNISKSFKKNSALCVFNLLLSVIDLMKQLVFDILLQFQTIKLCRKRTVSQRKCNERSPTFRGTQREQYYLKGHCHKIFVKRENLNDMF